MENIYELNKDGQCYRIESMVEVETMTMDNSDVGCSGSTSGNVMLPLRKEFLKEQKKEKLCLAIMPNKVQKDEGKSCMPMEIQKLLDEFVDIVVDDMSIGMPPMRIISH